MEYLQKTKTLKMTFFLDQSFAIDWTEVKIKYVFLTKIMLLNEIQVSFVSLCFFALTFFKSNSITFYLIFISRSNSFGSVSIYKVQK